MRTDKLGTDLMAYASLIYIYIYIYYVDTALWKAGGITRVSAPDSACECGELAG